MRAWGHPRRAPAILLAVVVVAGGCGGDEEPPPSGDGEQAQDLGEPLEPSGAQQDDALSGLESLEAVPADVLVSATDQEGSSEAGFALVPVELGFRFPWCAEIQERWNYMIEARAGAAAAAASYDDARETFDTVTDELDAAEARAALERAESIREERQSVLSSAQSGLMRLIAPGTPPISDNTTANIETHAIAVGRAREAFRDSADPATLELSELIHQVDWSVVDLTAEQEYGHYDLFRGGPAPDLTPPPSLAWEFYDEGGLPDNAPDDFEATRSAIENIRLATQEASSTAIPALEEMGRAITLAAEVSSHEDVLAASRALVGAMRSLSQVSAFSPLGLQDLVDDYHRRVREDLNQLFPVVRISDEDHNTWVAAIDEAAAMVEFPDITDQLPSWVIAELGEVPFRGPYRDDDYALGKYVSLAFRHGESLLPDLRRAGEEFLLADTAAVEAFWMSISESCEP